MTSEARLGALLAALRGAGLAVGVREVERLHAVFASPPATGGEDARRRLLSLLRAVVVKTPEERAVFERVAGAWLDRIEGELALWERPGEQPAVAVGTGGGRRRRRKGWRWAWAVVAAAGLAAAGVLLWLLLTAQPRQPEQEETITTATEGPIEPPPEPANRLPTPEELRQRSFTSAAPSLTVVDPSWAGWGATLLAALALAAGAGLWLLLRHRRELPDKAPPPDKPGPPRAFLAPPRETTPLLSEREREGLVWGIGQFISGERTRRLDLPATVRATARAAGVPQLIHQQARFTHEVWLWTDEATQDPALPRLAHEVEATLTAHGLAVERASFRGLPEPLVTPQGQLFAPREVEERRGGALVAILTDGRLLTRRYRVDSRRRRIDALLRSLSHWPHLAFVDFSPGGGELAAIAGRHEIQVLTPGELAAFLGAGGDAPAPSPPAAPPATGLGAWAGACALAPGSVDEERALVLLQRLRPLGVHAPAWALAALRAEAPGPPGRLCWSGELRARRINALAGAEEHPGRVSEGSRLAAALDFWQEHYQAELAGNGDREAPWRGTPAEQALQMERALLELWRPERFPGAVAELYGLYRGALKEPIHHHLEGLAPADRAGGGQVALPWPWHRRSGPERLMLRAMGLGGDLPAEGLRRPGRLGLGIGLCLGLAVGALAMAGRVAPEAASCPRGFAHGPGKPAEVRELSAVVGDACRVGVAAGPWLVTEAAQPGARVRVEWRTETRPCVEELAGGGEVWRCGATPQPPPLADDVAYSSVLLLAPSAGPEIEELAVALLYSDSAAEVRILGREGLATATTSEARPPAEPSALIEAMARDWRLVRSGLQQLVLAEGEASILDGAVRQAERLLAELRRRQPPSPGEAENRFAMATVADWEGLRERLVFQGTRTAAQVLPATSQVLSGDPQSVLLRGLAEATCPREEVDDNGFVFVRLCGGSFRLGSERDDPQAYPYEQPAHRVTLSGFAIGKFEVTNRQYRLAVPDHPLDDDLPVTGVNWEEADAFCRHFGYRLPTEAEWEYAARAGTTSAWSFGDDEAELGRFAWYNENSGGQPHEVGTREPNPWGIHDLHGNVWEWVEDRYGPYPEADQQDPTGPEGGTFKVLRGSSFGDEPGDLRSAFRFRYEPEIRIRYIGFRCVRGSGRQP